MATAAAALVLFLAATAAPDNPPRAPVDAVTEVHFGTQVTDPYRWLEDVESPHVLEFLRAQADYTQATLARVSAPRAVLLTRIQQLDAAIDSVHVPAGYENDTVSAAGPRLFYLKIRSGDRSASLYTRQLGGTDERRLLDPTRFAKGEERVSVAYFVPSPDGRLVAFGVSLGAESSVIHVVRTDTGEFLDEAIPSNTGANINWVSGHSFVYVKPGDQSNGRVATYARSGAYLHELGKDATRDRQVFGYGYSKNIPFEADDFSYVASFPESGYLVASLTHGTQFHQKALYVAQLSPVLHGLPAEWRQVTRTDDGVDDFDMHGSTLYVLTHKVSPNRDIRGIQLPAQSFADATVSVPASARVVSSLSAAGDALYITDQDGALQGLRRLAYRRGSVPEDIGLPFPGSVTVRASPNAPGAIVSDVSWTHYPLWYHLDDSGHFTDTHMQAPNPVDYSQVEAEEVLVPSEGGVQVPLSVLHLRNLRLDGSHPVWLEGYGAYGGVLSPDFVPSRLAWLERGGVYAVAHVRGGGEYGDRWHADGMLAHKQNSINDFLACAHYLVEKRFTSPAHIGAVGASAGGLLVSDAMVQHPADFGAVLDINGSADMVRFMLTPSGRFNAKEFGDITTAAGFAALYTVDAYHHIRDETPYPAVLLTGGLHDSRVPVWGPAKMAARLQAATSSGRPVLLSVDFQSGHGVTGSRAASESRLADQYTFMLWQLGDPDFQPHP